MRALLSVLLGLAVVFAGAGTPAVAYDEGTIVSLANDARAANGVNGLVSNASLDAVALGWAQQLAANGTLSHNPSVGEQIPGGWSSWGENVAQGYSSGAAVHDGWMNSAGHRANILGDFTDIGVALIEGGGTTWAVQVFARYPGSPAAPPRQVAPPPAADSEPEPEAPAAPAPAVPTPEPATTRTPPPSASPSTVGSTPASTPSATTTPVGAPGAATEQGDAALVAARDGAEWWPWIVVAGTLALTALLLAVPRVRRLLFGRSGTHTRSG